MRYEPRFPERNHLSPHDRGPSGPRRPSLRRAARPRLEALEGRALLATLTVTSPADSGHGTLREAIADAAPGDTIVFQRNIHAITLTNGEIAFDKTLKIEGPGANKLTVSGNNHSRIFDIGPDATDVTIAGLTIANGLANDQLHNAFDCEGGGVLNLGDLTLANDVFLNNQAVGVHGVTGAGFQGGARGGGVSNLGTLAVDDCQFIQNRAQGSDGNTGNVSGFGGGGAIFSGMSATASARIDGSLFVDNVAQGGNGNIGTFAGLGYGGAIVNSAVLDITGSTFLRNQALGGDTNSGPSFTGAGVGGAIGSGRAIMVTQTVKVAGTTFDFNSAVGGNDNTVTTLDLPPANGPNVGSGGAIQINRGSAEITDHSIFSHNQALGGQGTANGGAGVGGAIGDNGGLGATADVTVSDSTVDHNAAIGGPGGPGGAGGAGLGGGFFVTGGLGPMFRSASLKVISTFVDHNKALGGEGGDGGDGGNGEGGGLYNAGGLTTGLSTVTLTSATVEHNFALAGEGGEGGSDGLGLGGGVFTLGVFDPDASVILKNHATDRRYNNIYP